MSISSPVVVLPPLANNANRSPQLQGKRNLKPQQIVEWPTALQRKSIDSRSTSLSPQFSPPVSPTKTLSPGKKASLKTVIESKLSLGREDVTARKILNAHCLQVSEERLKGKLSIQEVLRRAREDASTFSPEVRRTQNHQKYLEHDRHCDEVQNTKFQGELDYFMKMQALSDHLDQAAESAQRSRATAKKQHGMIGDANSLSLSWAVVIAHALLNITLKAALESHGNQVQSKRLHKMHSKKKTMKNLTRCLKSCRARWIAICGAARFIGMYQIKRRIRATTVIKRSIAQFANTGSFLRTIRYFSSTIRTCQRLAKSWVVVRQHRIKLLRKQWDFYEAKIRQVALKRLDTPKGVLLNLQSVPNKELFAAAAESISLGSLLFEITGENKTESLAKEEGFSTRPSGASARYADILSQLDDNVLLTFAALRYSDLSSVREKSIRKWHSMFNFSNFLENFDYRRRVAEFIEQRKIFAFRRPGKLTPGEVNVALDQPCVSRPSLARYRVLAPSEVVQSTVQQQLQLSLIEKGADPHYANQCISTLNNEQMMCIDAFAAAGAEWKKAARKLLNRARAADEMVRARYNSVSSV